MPLVRYEIRNEYNLANPELYGSANKDDPQVLLEGVSMAGLVGIVRQLGDLAEFAAEVFHDLHEVLMATASRSHGLMVRVQQLEAEFPSIEKSLMYQNNQLRLAYIPSSDWHASIRNDQNHLTQGDLPRFILNSYEECRSPPRLFLLDKFDIAGAGACLKRYTDPSFFKLEWASSELMKAEKIQREKKARKRKGRRRRNGETSDITPSNARVRYSSLDLDNSIGGARSTTVSHHQVLKSKLNIEPSYLNTDSRKENGHMFEKPNISNGAVHLEPEVSYPFQDEAGAEKPVQKLFTLSLEQEDPNLVLHQVPSEQGLARVVNRDKLMEQSFVSSNSELESTVASQDLYPVKRNTKLSHMQQKYASAPGSRKPEIQASKDNTEDVGSEVDSYMDALATIELETELNSEEQTKLMSDIEVFNRPNKKSIMHSEAVDAENSAFYNCDSYDESLRLYIPSESLSKQQLAVASKSELTEKLTYDSALSHYPTDSYHGRSPVLSISVESSNDISVNMFEHGVSHSSLQKSNEELQSDLLQYHSIEGRRNLLSTKKESNNLISAYRSTHDEDVEMEERVNENIQNPVNIIKDNLQSEALDHVRLSVSEKQQTSMNQTDQQTEDKDDMDLQTTLHEELPDVTRISTKDTAVVELQPGTFEVQKGSIYTTNLSSSSSISETGSDKLSPLKPGDNEQSYLSSHSNEQLQSYQFQVSVAQNFSADLKQNYSRPQSNKDTEYAGCLSSNISSSFKTSNIQFNISGETAIYSQENGANKVGYSNDTEHAEMDPKLLKSHNFAAMIDNPSDIQVKVEKVGSIQIKKSVENVSSSTNPNISLSDGVSGNLNANLSLKTMKVNSRKEFQEKKVHFVSDESGAPSLSMVNDGCEKVIHDELSTMEFSSRDSVADRSVSISSKFNPKMSISAGSFKNIFDKKPWSEHDGTSLQMFKSHTRQESITGTETHLITMIRPVKPAGAGTAAEPLMVSPEKEEVDGEPSSPPLEHVKITFKSETDSPLSLASMSDDYFQEFSLSQDQNYSELSMVSPPLLSSHTNMDSRMVTVKQYHEQGQFHIVSDLPMESSEEIAVYSGRTIFDNGDDTGTPGSSPSSSSSLRMENISNLNLKSSRPEAGTSPSQLHNASLGSSRKSSFASLPHSPKSCIKDATDHCNQSSSMEPSILVFSSPTPDHVKEVISHKLHSSPLLPSIELSSSTIHERLDMASPEICSPAPQPPPLPLPLNTKNGPQNATDTFVPCKSLSTERKDSLIEAIASHDKSMLKKIPRQESNNIKPLGDREVLLEQIRTQSFNLRRTPAVAKQHSISRPVTNINVAAILEKANAIRQAYEESDEDEDDDDWSDS